MIVSQLRLVGQHPGQAVFRTLDSGQQFRCSIGNELGHDVARSAPRFDFGDSIRRADRLAIRRSRQIAILQSIAECPALVGEDGYQVTNPAKLGFQNRVGMSGDQVHDTFRSTDLRGSAPSSGWKPVSTTSGAYPMS